MAEFIRGTKVKLTNGDSVTIMSTLGEGGQGTVYKVDYNGKQYALKWYLPNFIKSLKPNYSKFYKNLVDNVQNGSPSQQSKYSQNRVKYMSKNLVPPPPDFPRLSSKTTKKGNKCPTKSRLMS